MKTRLLKYIFPLIFFACLQAVNCFGQTVTITSANSTSTNGVDASPLSSGATNAVLFGFTVTVSGSVTISQFVLHASQSYYTNAKLYRSAAGSVNFSGSTLIATIGSPGTYIGISGLNETINNTSYTYFLVADIAVPGYVTLPANLQFNVGQAIRSSPYTSYNVNVTGINYTISNPTYTLTSANAAVNGITQGDIISSQTSVVLFGFGVKASGNTTVSGFNINSSSTSNFLSYYIGNGRLYRSTSSTFSFGTATLVSGATVAFSNYQHTPGVAISGLSESISTSNTYYFLVADFNQGTGTLPADIQFNFSTSQTNAIVQTSPNSANIAASSNITGTTFTFANPSYTLTSANTAGNGITQGTITPNQTNIVLYGFGISANASTTVSGFNLNSSSTGSYLSYYLGNGRLYRSASSSFSFGTATLVTGATVAFSNYQHTPGIAISGLSESISATTVYYFIVADYNQAGGALPSNIQFQFNTSQTNAIVQSAPNVANITAPSTLAGTTFTFANPSYTLTDANTASNGITQGTLRPGQTGIVLFGFGISASGNTTVSGFTLLATAGNPQSYFTNGKLYRSSSDDFSSANLVAGATVSFGSSISPGLTISGLSESITTTTQYYFIVGDFNANYYGSLSSTMQFKFTTAQINGIIQTSPISTNITPSGNITGTNFALDIPSITITGYNSSLNGITQGVLQYQQTDIVLFGFGIAVTGGLTINQLNIPNNNTDSYFGNGILYSSPTSVFSPATAIPITGITINFYQNYIHIAGLNEVFNTYTSTTTNYYFIVADYSQIATSSGTIQFGFNTGQNPQAIIQSTPSKTFNTFTVTNGTVFSLGLTYEWAGSTTSFTTPGNFRNLYNSTVSTAPGANDQVRIGVNTNITNTTATAQPTISANASLTRIVFGNVFTPKLTIASGVTLTTSSDVTVNTNSSPTLVGPGNLAIGGNLTNNGTTVTQTTAKITVTGTVTNAGTYKQTGAGTMTAGSLTNTGTYQQTSTGKLTVNGAMTNAGTYSKSGSGTLTVGGKLTNNSGKTMTLGTSATTLNGDLSNAGTITQGTGGFDFNGSSFTNSGTFTITSGANTFAGTSFNNTGTLNLGTGTITFDGTGTTSISTTPTLNFNNIKFSNGGTKTLTAGSFNIINTGVLTMLGATTLNANGNLTLKSDASSSASITAIPSGASITGDVKVERFFTGGGTPAANSYRAYRLISSPVTDGLSGLSYLYTGGPGGTSNGFSFTNPGTSTVFLYREDVATNTGSFNSGNYKGIAALNASPFPVSTLSNTYSIYPGTGIMVYYVGSTASGVNYGTRTGSPAYYPAPDNTTMVSTGTLNQGNIPVKLWYNSGSSTLSYTTGISNVNDRGLTLVGNPYASTIDWDTFSNTASSAGIYGPNVTKTVYVYNYSTKTFGAYQAGTTGGIGTNNAGRYIASGQGFFVKGSTTGASLTFHESAKTITQPNSLGSSYLLMGLPDGANKQQMLRIKLTQDGLNNEDILLSFEPDAADSYETDYDADHIKGVSNLVSLSSFAKNSGKQLSINHMHSIDSLTHVKLNFTANAAGIDTLSATGFETLDPRYDVYLLDHYKKDSLMISQYGKYFFNIVPADTNSFGSTRFELVFHKKPSVANYQLLSFTGKKADDGIQLTWKTQNETNFTGFTIQRADGSQQFLALYSLQSDGKGNYTYTDQTPAKGINQYRLMQNDAFSHISYSPIISVDAQNVKVFDDNLMIYPNPVIGQLQVKVSDGVASSNKVNLTIMSASGQYILSKEVDINAIDENVSRLQTGSYILQITDTATKKVIGRKKFIKL